MSTSMSIRACPAEALLEPAAAQNVAALVAFTIVFGFIAATLTAHSLAGHVLYADKGVPLFAFALPIIVLVGGVFCVAEYVSTRRLASASLRWPTAAGRITHCAVIEEIIEDKGSDDDKSRPASSSTAIRSTSATPTRSASATSPAPKSIGAAP